MAQEKDMFGKGTGDKSKREVLMARLASKYPDRNLDDEESLFGAVEEDFSNAMEELEKFKGDNAKIMELFKANPQLAQVFMEISNGVHPAVAIAKNFGKQALEAADEDALRQVEELNQTFMDRISAGDKLEQERSANMEASLPQIDDFKNENNLSDDEYGSFIEFVVDSIDSFLMAKIDKSVLDTFWRAYNFDTAVSEARTVGEISGRNAKIEENRASQKSGDGVISPSSIAQKPVAEKGKSIFFGN